MFNKSIKQSVVSFMLAVCLGFGAQMAMAQGEHSHHDEAPAPLTLNNGKKWPTDQSLRQGMAAIRDALAADLHAIHDNKATDKQYRELAKKVNGQIAYMTQNCKLDKETDAMLHLILVELIDGAKTMSDQKSKKSKRPGAEKIAHALEQYAIYFDHPGWRGLE